jgi:hypothetical protein
MGDMEVIIDYQLKPDQTIVQAIQFDGSSTVVDMFEAWDLAWQLGARWDDRRKHLEVLTPAGFRSADLGDWIIKTEFFFYVMPDASFRATFKKAKAQSELPRTVVA